MGCASVVFGLHGIGLAAMESEDRACQIKRFLLLARLV